MSDELKALLKIRRRTIPGTCGRAVFPIVPQQWGTDVAHLLNCYEKWQQLQAAYINFGWMSPPEETSALRELVEKAEERYKIAARQMGQEKALLLVRDYEKKEEEK